jgi:hypothetical protein
MSPIVWQYVGYFAGPLVLVLFGLLLWTRREQRRARAFDLAATFSEWHLDDLARLAKAYTIGNYLGADSVTRIIHQLISRLETEGAPAVFRGLGWKMVDVFARNPDDLKKLKDVIATVEALAAKAVVAAAPVLAAAVPAAAPLAAVAAAIPSATHS